MEIHQRSPIGRPAISADCTGAVKALHLRLAVGLLVLVLTAGCSDPGGTDCEITCSDGFKTTEDGSCIAQISNIIGLSRVHGSCNGDEK
jgi:hypothetical protein